MINLGNIKAMLTRDEKTKFREYTKKVFEKYPHLRKYMTEKKKESD
jgi:hypothetical protein